MLICFTVAVTSENVYIYQNIILYILNINKFLFVKNKSLVDYTQWYFFSADTYWKFWVFSHYYFVFGIPLIHTIEIWIISMASAANEDTRLGFCLLSLTLTQWCLHHVEQAGWLKKLSADIC